MDISLALFSLIVSSMICWPMYKYMWKAVVINEKNVEIGHAQEFPHEHHKYKTINSFTGRHTLGEGVREYHLLSIVTALLLPSLPTGVLAVIVYFICLFLDYLYKLHVLPVFS
ncbi:hypothetical protein [Vibrio parahaemolyticus]|uniref:hypothetical protein n=1 Tax=Vibrio parahaemolyticus TaxID=670 RepID=UPI00046F7804|nr:hypothetical protein [Vibrio parahaemolyticus]